MLRQYRSGYHFIDRSNQEGSYYNVDRKTVRKQNRVLEDAIETYALINTHTVYINSPNVIQGMGKDEIASDQFRFEIARVWFAKCRALNGRSSVHYLLCRSKRNRSIYSLIHSPRKGTHAQSKIDSSNSKKQLRCCECSNRTTFKCEKCGSFGVIVALCSRERNDKDCWRQYHNKRTFDLPSSQGICTTASSSQSQDI